MFSNSCIRWNSALALLAICAACSGEKEELESTTAELREGSTTVSGTEEGRSASRPVELKHVGTLVDLVVAEAAELPYDEFEPQALARKLGEDPIEHFRWVRDHTRWVPYRGLLRGSKGVMLDRVGSNLDRAVLLGDLLRLAGHEVRIARAQLPPSTARALLARLTPIGDHRPSELAHPEPSSKRHRPVESSVPGLGEMRQRQIVDYQHRFDAGTALVRSQTDMLQKAVKSAAKTDTTGADESAIASLQDYWWIEIADDGKWIALDLLAPDARPGAAMTAPSATFGWEKASGLPSIPEEDWHTVYLRVVVERYLAGQTSESTVLETVLRPAEVFDRPISLVHLPKPWPDQRIDSESNPNALNEAALRVRQWTPVLRVGDQTIVKSGFAENGDVKTKPLDPLADLSGGIMGGMDSALGGGEEYEPYASAEWIDYEIHVPGQTSQHVRRQVFDLLGPGRRQANDPNFNGNAENRRVERAEALLSRTDILVQPCAFTNEFIVHQAISGIVALQDEIRRLGQLQDVEERRVLASSILERMNVRGPVLGFPSWRDKLGKQSQDWFISRPNLISLRTGQRIAGAARPDVLQLVDIVANATDVHLGAARSAFDVRLERGVADTVAEMLILTGDLSKAENTAAIFDMSGGGQSSRFVIAPRDVAGVTELNWPDDEAARVTEDVSAGFLVVPLRQPVELGGVPRVGWWRIEPRSGETIGVMDTGFHAFKEYESSLEWQIAYYDNLDRTAMWVVGTSTVLTMAGALALIVYCETGGALPGCTQ